MTDPNRSAAHRRRHVAVVKLGHRSGFFFCGELQVGLEEEEEETGNAGVVIQRVNVLFCFCVSGFLYLRSQVQHQVFDHVPKWFGESQQLVEVGVSSSETNDVHHPHALRNE